MWRVVLVELFPVELDGKRGEVLEDLVAKVNVVARDVCDDPHEELLGPLLRRRPLRL